MKHSVKDAFFAILRAGLWEQGVNLLPFEPLDFAQLYELADEQSVVGLLAAGLERIEDRRITKSEALPFLIKAVYWENRNREINLFIAQFFRQITEAGIQTVLVKGQGVGQCYSRPLWRSFGDIDLLLNTNHYEKAKSFLQPMASDVGKENPECRHLGMTIDSWPIELHGTLHGNISKYADTVVDRAQANTLSRSEIRVWKNEGTDVFLPAPDNDVIFIFSHIQQHFFRGGIGLRQICDWCRFLWTYHNDLDRDLLESRIREMRMTTEWRAFAAFAIEYLGMPKEAMPLYNSGKRWKRKARHICSYILLVGNFGHNRDNSFYSKHSYLAYKTISLTRHICDFFKLFIIFPIDSLRVFVRMIKDGVKALEKGE